MSASPERVFVDTNVLIHAYDNEEGEKQKIAKHLLTELWHQHTGIVSTQVLAEFYHVATRKLKMPCAVARKIVAAYGAWCSADTSHEMLVSASLLEEEHGLSWWDSLIVEGALLSGADTLLSEDLRHGRTFGSLTVRNPFVESN